ncbi:hypothetical protein Mevan_0122 [Methanococcus vannielii SB]|uniref:Phosphoribosyltransferase n=1 Tax=Methanococcus vannielii (strain ATCC 35089 / DSM 1224 / JCM 13029 / OCM 148 / SB) TaxID=406327 RepID=A6UNG2_METVS|nr:phosphoribosyltransferase [Methanococcus vannielii]ABR54034.1 hypothetical protein Mevan_0122 [Methanococcus vannielii SB]
MVNFATHGWVNGHFCSTIFYYYPIRSFSNTNELNSKIRNKIYDFKEGRNPNEIGELVSSALISTFGKDKLRNCTFVTVPASSVLRTEKRCKSFSKIVSSITGMENGYNFVKRCKDSKPKHITGCESENYYSLFIEKNLVMNKRIILFDDIITSGKTIDFISKRLKWYCKSVDVVGLGKTVSRGSNEYLNQNCLGNALVRAKYGL